MVSFTGMLFNGTLALIAGFLLYAVVVFAYRKYRLKDFGGPFAIPLLGNLWDPEAPKLIIYLRKQTKNHGRMFSFWPGMSPVSFYYTSKLDFVVVSSFHILVLALYMDGWKVFFISMYISFLSIYPLFFSIWWLLRKLLLARCCLIPRLS
jgi:hypothetical protein